MQLLTVAVVVGKHDGSCVDSEGILHRYFSCVDGAGSFVKHSKIVEGKSLAMALSERYVGMDAPEIVAEDSTLPDAFVTTSRGRQKSIELLGEKKIRKWQQLHAVKKVVSKPYSLLIHNHICNID